MKSRAGQPTFKVTDQGDLIQLVTPDCDLLIGTAIGGR